MPDEDVLELRTGEFLRLRLRGKRFRDGSISLGILRELAALRDMVLKVARLRYLDEHPWRKRSPRRFTKMDLILTGLERGSSVPLISVLAEDRNYIPLYEQARDDIIELIGAFEDGYPEAGRNHLPRYCLSYFNRIGRSLRDGECIEFLTPRRNRPVRLTKASRLRLLDMSAKLKRHKVTLRGVISEVDEAQMTFELQPMYGRTVRGPIPPDCLSTVVRAFTGRKHREMVLVEGFERIDRSRRMFTLEEVQRIVALDNCDVPARLDEFRNLNDGWLEGEGQALDHKGLDWLSDSFLHHYPQDLPLPHTFPTPEGCVEMEWSFGPQSVILEIDLKERHGDWLRFDQASDEEYSDSLPMSEDSGWERMVAEIRRLLGRTA